MSTVAYSFANISNATTIAISAGSSSSSDVIPKSVITICILVAGFLLGVGIAKLVNYCYNRADVPDNASDISEHTKGLLRIQLALLKFGKSGSGPEDGVDPEEAKRQQQATVLSMWKMKAMNKAAAAQKAKEDPSVQVVNETGAVGKKGKAGTAAAAAPGKGGAAGPSTAGGAAKKGAAASSIASKAKPAARPKKLFPNSVAGVAPAAAAPSTAPGTARSATAKEPPPNPPVAKATTASLAKSRSQTPTRDRSGGQAADNSENPRF